jgi:methionine-rich copper-binding protein CopC
MDNSINDILGVTGTQSAFNPVNDSSNADLFKPSSDSSLSQQLSINRFEQSLIQAPLAAAQSITERGVFSVDQTGKLTIDFLADSGSYRSEMAIFSLRGMDGFTLGSNEFIKEAASRALSSSSLGYVVINDSNEGARFIGDLGESDKNDDQYTGVKTFDFTPGDRVAMMLVPQGTIREVLNSALLDGNKLPLFSITGANPGKATQLGQILPNVFGWEDLRIDQGGDADYNDIVFQVKGAVTTQIDLGKLAASGKDWQDLPFARQIFSAVFEDKNSPDLKAGLLEDTGANKLDQVTSNPVITGTVTDDGAIRRLRAGFGDSGKTIDILSLLQDDGNFTLDRQELVTLQGSELIDGDYKLILEAEDKFGKVSKSIIDLVLDTKAAIAPSEIKIKDNLGIITNQKTPTLIGKAETGTTIQIFEGATRLGETIAANGLWELVTTQLTDGAKSLTVQSIDLAGNNSSSTFALIVDTVLPTFNLATTNTQLNLGAKLQGSIDGNGSAIDRVSYRFGNGVEVVVPVNAQGQFDVAFDFGGLSGTQNLVLTAVDVAGNVTTTTSVVTINTDNTLPRAALTSQASTAANYLELAFDKPVTDESFAADKYSLKLTDGAQAGRDISISSIQKLSSTQVRVNLVNPLAIGNYRLALAAGITDAIGNVTTASQVFDLRSVAPAVTISPADGEERISLSRDTVIRFGKKIDPTTVNNDSFYLIANGERVAGRIKVSSTEEFATFFYDAPLPAATAIRVVVDGNKIIGRDGLAVDGDGNGTPGGMATGDFSTLPITPIPGTEVWGYVYDSYNKNPDGSNIPLKNVTIRLDSLPNVTATTDDQGYFILKNLPASDFFVYIDGAKAVGLPTVSQYAGLGKAFHSVPGQSTQLFANGQTFNIYLPPMAASDIQTLSTDTDTNVGFGSAAQAFLQQRFPNVDADLWKQVQVTFKAGSAQDDAGVAATQATIIPVDPSRLPAPLPAGFDPKLVISIQAGGVNGFNREAQGGSTNFDVPAPIQFPNLDGLRPGEKSVFWSFDHAAGQWIAIGLGTVSVDGKTIISDPGVGVIAPGWHFASPPLNWTGSGGSPQGNKNSGSNPQPVIFQNLISTKGSNVLGFTFTPPPGAGAKIGQHVLPQGGTQPTRVVTITVEGQLNDYYKPDKGGGIRSGSWTLNPGDPSLNISSIQKSLDELKNGLNGGKVFEQNILYGSKIIVKEVLTLADGSTQKSERIFFPYMLIDATDTNKEDLKLNFAQTINDGTGSVQRELPLEIRAGRSSQPNISLSSTSNYTLANGKVIFDPTVDGSSLISEIQIKNPLNGNLAGNISLEGKGVQKQGWRFDAASFETIAKAIGDDNGTRFPTIPASERALMDTKAERDAILASIATQTTRLFNDAGLTPGIFQSLNTGANVLNVGFVEGVNPTGNLNGWDLGGAIGSLTPADVDLAKIIDVYNNRNNYSQLERGYRIAEEVNKQLGGDINFYYDNFFELQAGLDTNAEMQIAFGHNNAHEIGHHLGLFHTGSSSVVRLAGGTDDVLRQGLYLTDTQKFNLTKEAASLALHVKWTGADADKAIAYYAAYQAAGGNFNSSEYNVSEGNDDNTGAGLNISRKPSLGLFSIDGSIITSTFDLGTVLADGIGGEAINTSWSLSNIGFNDLKLTEVSASENDQVIEIPSNITGKVLSGSTDAQLNFNFDPTQPGEFSRDIVIKADNGENLKIRVTGTAINPNPVFDVKISENNNNFGGVNLGETKIDQQFITISNKGKATLRFTPTIDFGGLAFDISGFAGVQQSLEFGQSIAIPVTFKPSFTGIEPGAIKFVTNDPNKIEFRQGITGTGIPNNSNAFDWGKDFVVVEYNDFLQRKTSNENGDFMFAIPTFTEYKVSVFDPASGLIAKGSGFTGVAGAFTDLTSNLSFAPSTTADTDFDGLPDDIEFAIGSAVNKNDTDADGISDFAEIQQGIDPLGGRGFPTGIIASLPLKGEAKAVVVEGSITNPQNQTAYVATGSYGLAVVNTSQFNSPIVLGQLDLLGNATDIAVDSKRNIAAVAANDGGLHLVNVADGMLPILNQTIKLAANQVEVADGIAYATVNNTLHVIDLSNGQELQILTLPGFGTITGLAREGTKLYAYVSGSDTFSIVDIAEEGAANLLGQLNVNIASTDVGVSAGNGVAYLAGSGLSTIDVSDPLNPKLISGADTFFTARSVALNGSGLALVSAEDQGLGIYSINDLQKTNNVLAVVDTPGFTYGAAIASGIAYIVDGNSGLQVINYLPFDNKGQSPTVNISTNTIDLDLNAPEIQVIEGSTIPLQVNISDDVQVRNVELLVDGQVVTNDVSFPWDLSVIAPTIIPGKTTFAIQVRTTDTGGNTALSNRLTLSLSPDRFAPTVLGITPAEGSSFRLDPTIAVSFNEAIDPTKLNSTGITLTNFGTDGILGSNDDMIIPLSNVQTRSFDKTLVVKSNGELATGNYQLRIAPGIIADRVGNTLVNPIILGFTKLATVNINTSAIDLDPITAGIQVLEGSDIPLLVDIRKDLQVRNVELVVNGQVVSSNDSFTPHLSVIAPAIALSKSTVDIQIRTTDINGATAISNQLTLNLVADRSAPIVLETSPIEGVSTRIIPTITVKFNEAIDSTKFNSNGFTLTNLGADRILGSSDDIIIPISNFQTQDLNRTLVIRPDAELATGNYQLSINPSVVSDRIGNSPTTPVRLNFTKRSFGNILISLGTSVTGRLSQPGDDELYSFTGSTGQFISLRKTLDRTSEGVVAEFISPSGEYLGIYPFAVRDDLFLSLNETGQYLINIKSSNNLSSDFGFLIEEKTFSAS